MTEKTFPALADTSAVNAMVATGQLIPSSTRPDRGQLALIDWVNSGERLAVCGVGYAHSMKAEHPDARLLESISI